jgi:hypothetical protein
MSDNPSPLFVTYLSHRKPSDNQNTILCHPEYDHREARPGDLPTELHLQILPTLIIELFLTSAPQTSILYGLQLPELTRATKVIIREADNNGGFISERDAVYDLLDGLWRHCFVLGRWRLHIQKMGKHQTIVIPQLWKTKERLCISSLWKQRHGGWTVSYDWKSMD